MFFKSVDLYYEPEKVCNQITKGMSANYSEMSSFQKAFLCGMLKNKRPQKILELGVAGGGTTATILTCLKAFSSNAEMYSVDLAEKWYRTGKLETGFVAKEYMKEIVGGTKHKFLLGKTIPHFIDEIGTDIDFVILDTTHSLPGELLDFLICYPFLKDGCIVVLHDIINNLLLCDENSIATKLLFNLMQENKWYMQEDIPDALGFSNIAAFEVTKKSREYIDNIFSSLTFNWTYSLENDDVEQYWKIINRFYGVKYGEYFKKIVEIQKYTQIKKYINIHYHMSHEFLRMKWKKSTNVFLYGTGFWADIYSEYARINDLPISGYVISDDQNIISKTKNNKKVYKIGELPYTCDECSFILTLDHKHFVQVRRNLENTGYYKVL